MQTSTAAQRITTIAHGTNVVLPTSDNLILVDDTRLRNWQMSESGGLNYANPIVARLNEADEILRIRTTGNFYTSGTLEIQYAVPTDLITWSANTIVADAFAGSGVDLFVGVGLVQAYWVDGDAVTVKMAESVDDGHTWGVPEVVATLSNQGTDVAIQLACPDQDICFFTDSLVGEDENGLPLTAIYMAYKSSGVWQTPVLWDMGGQPLGVERQVTLPDANTYTSNLSAVSLGTNKAALAFYSNNFRESFGDGVWTGRVSNIDLAVTSQHLHWSSPEQIFTTVGIDNDNSATRVFTSFPRLQLVGSEYWIVALEISEYAGHERYHLAFFRSTDGIVFSDRDYNQGAASDEQEGAYEYEYQGKQPFLVTDLIYANLVVTQDRTFIIGFDKTFYCLSTSLVGVDNPARQFDITPYVDNWSVNLPTAPSMGTATYSLGNVPKNWNDDDLLAAHRGIRIKQFGGYFSSIYSEDELVELGEFWIDTIEQTSEQGAIDGQVQAFDNVGLMERYQSDIYWEWFGPEQAAYDKFCDTIPFTVVQGNMYSSVAGNLRSAVVKQSDNFRDDIACLNLPPSDGGILVTKFRCAQTWGTTGSNKNHMGVAFQGKAGENDQFWAVLYNRTTSRFTLNRAIPRTNPNRVKLYQYERFLQESDSIVLAAMTSYWLKVAVWHGHVIAWYSTDGVTFTKVIDYTSPASPANAVIPSRLEWWALIGTQRRIPSGVIGATGTADGMQTLDDGSGNPLIVAKHVQLGSKASVLRRVAVALTQENTSTSDTMPDATIMLITGDRDTEPDDATDENNILDSWDASSLKFNPHANPKWLGANGHPNPETLRFLANEHIWIAVTFDGTLSAGQSYKWASHPYANDTVVSTDGGATWSPASYSMAAGIEVEYLNGLIKFNNLYFGQGNVSRTYEDLMHRIAAKAGVLDITADSFLLQSDLTLQADNIYWQPLAFGTIGDLLLDVDVTLGTIYSTTGHVIVGSSTIGVGDGNAFIIEIDRGLQFINFYAQGNTLIGSSESLAFIPDTFHLQVVNQNDFLYVYINETLAAMQYDADLSVPGYVGLDSVGATWSNLRIPDLYHLVEYFDLAQKESAISALQRLIAKPAAGTVSKGKFFARYDGSLRILGPASYRNAAVDTYEDEDNAVKILQSSKTETGRYQVSEVDPQGNYYAKRFSGKVLDTDGRIYREEDFTDARSDNDAYVAAESVFIDAKEKQVVPTMQTIANYAAEREDKIDVINPMDKTGDTFIVNSLTFTGDVSKSEQETGVRVYVP